MHNPFLLKTCLLLINKSNSFIQPGKDDFGSDPFAALHAPTGQGQVLSPNTQKSGPPRPESPSPALPPKKSKVPPPRPAPPRPVQVSYNLYLLIINFYIIYVWFHPLPVEINDSVFNS